jgi:hypothetical protein
MIFIPFYLAVVILMTAFGAATPILAVDSFSEVSREIIDWESDEKEKTVEEASAEQTKPDEKVPLVIEEKNFKQAKFNVIDKRNGRVNSFIVDVGSSQQYETVIINVHNCVQEKLKRYNQENKTLVEIFNFTNSSIAERRFYGWLFSNSPASSFFAHERFDITLEECL